MSHVNNDLLDRLKQSLQGKSVTIRDLHALMPAWPNGVNVHVERLRHDVNQHIDRWFEPETRARKLKSDDAALFGAMWWSYANYEGLRVATLVAIFLLAWDDETDSSEFSSISDSFERSQTLRRETIRWASHCLGFGPTDVETPSNPLIANFVAVGRDVRDRYDSSQRGRLLHHIQAYVETSGLEQQMVLRGQCPSLQEYKRLRRSTSAVTVCLAMTELCFGMSLPQDIMESPTLARLWDATNVIIFIANDVLSLRKEVASAQVYSLVPLLFDELGDVQAAIDAATEEIATAVQHFNSAAEAMRQVYRDDPAHADVEKMIIGCQTACTANVNWSLRSKRYKLNLEGLTGGAEIVL